MAAKSYAITTINTSGPYYTIVAVDREIRRCIQLERAMRSVMFDHRNETLIRIPDLNLTLSDFHISSDSDFVRELSVGATHGRN